MDVPRILDAISSPADLKVLDNEELAILAREIRQEIVATTSVTGGHVASSLGAVDIIVALESLLDMPRDRVVFDVGHQAYAHKLLTGRREAFKTLRTYGGLHQAIGEPLRRAPVGSRVRLAFHRHGSREGASAEGH